MKSGQMSFVFLAYDKVTQIEKLRTTATIHTKLLLACVPILIALDLLTLIELIPTYVHSGLWRVQG